MEWFQYIINILGADRYTQHSICLTNDPLILVLFLAAHLCIFAAYTTISICFRIHPKTELHLSPSAKLLYSNFVGLCGLTHLAACATLFVGIYRLEVGVLALTAAVSLSTAALTLLATMKKAEGPGAKA